MIMMGVEAERMEEKKLEGEIVKDAAKKAPVDDLCFNPHSLYIPFPETAQ